MKQKERILEHLKKYNNITSWEAIKEYGCTRLSAIIWLLRKEIKELKKMKRKPLNNIICERGYQNHPENIQKYGNCRGCGKIIDEMAYFKYEMFKKLNLWRYNKNKRNIY